MACGHCVPVPVIRPRRPHQRHRDVVRNETAQGNGTHDIDFGLWDAEDAGVRRWFVERDGLTVQDGYVTVTLGAVEPLPDSLFTTYESLWLEVTVDDIDLSSRTRLVSVPWAIQAATAANVDPGTGEVFDDSGNLTVPGSVQVGDNTAPCEPALAGTLRWHNGALSLCDGSDWGPLAVGIVADGSSVINAAQTCWSLHQEFPETVSGDYWLDPDGPTGNAPFTAYCDMTPSSPGWTLVAIANSATQPAIDYDADASDPSIGRYVKPLRGAAGTESRFDCGASGTGVIGFQINSGTWSWSGTHISATLGTLVSDNVVWPADLPGYNSPDAGDPWSNHTSSVHFPNFGHTGFNNVDGRTFRIAFTCNPQSSAYGSGDTAWASYSGSRYIRYWLR